MALFRRRKDQGSASTAAGSLEETTLRIGRELLDEARRHRAGLLSGKFWSDQLMNWAMKDQAFKVQLFRFIDVFPVLATPQQVHAHLMEYMSQPGVTMPTGMGMGMKAGGMFQGTMAKTISSQIVSMAKKFIVGETPATALPELRKLWDDGMAFSVDLLGEACVSDAEAAVYQQRYLDLVNTLPGEVGKWPAKPTLETDYLGPIPRVNVSIKISSLYARTSPIDTEGSVRGLVAGLKPILQAAARHNVLVNFDMEHNAFKDLTLDLFERCCAEVNFPAGLAIQAYLRSGEADAARIIAWTKRAGRTITVRLIKGAYWDYETVRADQMGWPSPVWMKKVQTDACFERMAEMFIGAMPVSAGEPGIKLALGSHNVRSISRVLGLLAARSLPESAVELQLLHGMADELKVALAARGLRVREYAPVGQMIPGMAYFVRRLLENTSNESWLRAGFADNASTESLLASPHGPDAEISRSEPLWDEVKRQRGRRHQLSAIHAETSCNEPFVNEPLRDFSDAAVRGGFAVAVRSAVPPRVAIDATVAQADQAVARATTALAGWRDRSVGERAAVLLQAAQRMRQRRDELSGVIIKEAGKTWGEADADVCEAIDFCEFYAREAISLFEPQRLGRFAGERNEYWHQPKGVAAVISPWNFPLAICAGMTVAALVTGNPTIVKPSQQTPGIARLLCEILWESGAPADVLQFVPGRGSTVGAALVRDPRVAIIAFTGSKDVGLDIIGGAAITPDNQPFVKKIVCEMGGKNAIIVDESADLDEAVLGVRQSAFSYCGQKCSACSRAVVVGSAYEPFLRRLVEATRALVVGDPLESGTDMGPVIDASAAAKIREYIAIGRGEGKLEVGGEPPMELEQRLGKPFVMPHIFSGIEPKHRLAQEEIFGPVLSVMRAASFAEALAIANGTVYKLTGGVFSRTPSHLEQARQAFRVGNLYLNRGSTGALVGRQPFGGFGLSGLGSKAGGRDYLLHFVDPRCCTENTLRRGFAPEE